VSQKILAGNKDMTLFYQAAGREKLNSLNLKVVADKKIKLCLE